jgi:hypothetical protein
MDGMNRRDFAGTLAALLGTMSVAGAGAEAQSPAAKPMKELTSGVFKPQPGKGMVDGHESHSFLAGMLKAGNIRLEMHESVQQPGAPHEAVGTHKHSEIWLMQRAWQRCI